MKVMIAVARQPIYLCLLTGVTLVLAKKLFIGILSWVCVIAVLRLVPLNTNWFCAADVNSKVLVRWGLTCVVIFLSTMPRLLLVVVLLCMRNRIAVLIGTGVITRSVLCRFLVVRKLRTRKLLTWGLRVDMEMLTRTLDSVRSCLGLLRVVTILRVCKVVGALVNDPSRKFLVLAIARTGLIGWYVGSTRALILMRLLSTIFIVLWPRTCLLSRKCAAWVGVGFEVIFLMIGRLATSLVVRVVKLAVGNDYGLANTTVMILLW